MSITMNGYITVEGPNTALISGSVSNPTSIIGVEVFDGSNDVGAASLNSDGTWTFDAFFDPDAALTAVGTDTSGKTETSNSLFISGGGPHGQIEAVQGLGTAEEIGYVYGPKGRTLYTVDVMILKASINAHLDGQSDAPVIYLGPTSLNTENINEDIDNFTVNGRRHDILDISDSGIQNLADVLQRTTENNGASTIHIDSHTTITLDNVTKQQIAASHHDFIFASPPPAS